jgi:sporulation protein YlmC with PRC-barrel domain
MKALKDLSGDDLELARDVLDKQVVDREETKMGRVDGLVLELREGLPPRIDHIEMGAVVLARRLSPGLERWVDGWRRRFGVRKVARYRVPWSAVQEITSYHLKLDVAALDTPTFDWERWLQDHVIKHIPMPLKGKEGGGEEEEEKEKKE